MRKRFERNGGNPAPLFIGEAPPKGIEPDRHVPLFHLPENASGGRLMIMTGLTQSQYMAGICKTDLLPLYPGTKWPKEEAEKAAQDLVHSGLLEGRNVVCLGKNVFQAFYPEMSEEDAKRYFLTLSPSGRSRAMIGWMYHPSGRVRWYNTQANKARAMEFLREVCKGVPSL